MVPKRLTRAIGAYQKAYIAQSAALAELYAAIADATRAGVAQREIIEVTGYSREQVRRICRAAGIEAKT